MLARFDRLNLRAKLTLGFGALLALMLAGGGTALFSHNYAVRAVDTFIDHDTRIARLSLLSGTALGQARRFEKEFLLSAKEAGFEETKSRYTALVGGQLAALRDNMAAIRRLSDDADTARQSQAIEALAARYEAGFLTVVELYGRLGRTDTGLEGRFRQRAHAIEASLAQGAPERLMAGLLTLRRHEKDFVMRGARRYADAFDAAAARFARDVARSGLPAARRADLTHLTGEYRALFSDYAATAGQIEAATETYVAQALLIEPQLERLHARAIDAAAATRESLRRLGAAASGIVVAAGLVAILLGLAVAGFIVRNANRSVGGCVAFAGRLAAGDWSARLPADGGANEFATLAAALNRMADALDAAHRRDAARTADLERLNRTLRVLSRCNEALVRARSESDLLDGICHHIVDTGGYRMAWVGFARQDERRSIEPVAHAGVGADYVAHLDLSWGDDERRRGGGGAAIREGCATIARHIATDAAFAPWRNEATLHGVASCMALPLRAKGEVLGMLSIYAAEADAFDDEEARLLQELADDLAYGLVSLRDAEARKRAEQALAYHTNFDSVTGLPSRNLFGDRLRQALAQAAHAQRGLAVLLLGLDRFKAINDSFGRDAGDALLKHVGQGLVTVLRDGDTVARLSNDEFAITLTDLAHDIDVAAVALKLLDAALQPLAWGERDLYTTASIGISVYPKDGGEAESLLQYADAAMSSAKELGGNLFRFYAPEMNDRISTRFALESGLRRALERGELRVHYQPAVSLQSGELTSAEALVRWQHPESGLVPPGEFIPLAEDTGLILALGAWVIESVCRQLRAWLDAGRPVPPVAVNLSARQLRHKDIVATIRRALDDNRLDAKYLKLEITESALMDDMAASIATLRELKSLGVRIALDDFGTGYSSLSHLKHLPIDCLKIDQSFIRELTTDAEAASICIAIIGLAHNLRLAVIAEGVETEGQATYLRQYRCDEMQGYYFGRPMPAADFEQLLARGQTLALPEQPAEERRTLLLVDDEPNVLSALKRLLRRDGYDILTAGSARQGFELLATHRVQVIVSDQRMPEMNGTEFLAQVRTLYPDTIRIVLSGYTELGSITEAINRGSIYKFLTKPWEEEAFRKEVRDAFLHHEAARRQATSETPG